MTTAGAGPRLVFTDLPGAVGALRRSGLRLSTSRRLVLEALFAADGLLTAERIAQVVGLDLASVYRNLETFERHGLARHVHLGHGAGLYELVGRGEREYLHCERCGAVEAVQPAQLDAIRTHVRELFGYQVRFTHFPIVGVCAACAPAESGAHRAHDHEH